jgi:Dna[CI] antecedent, DciA
VIARNAWPARFQRDGTLVVHTRDSVWAFELTQRAGEIEKRLDGVTAIKFVAGPLPEPDVEVAQATRPVLPAPSPEQVEEAARLASEIENEDLREIVTRAIEKALAQPPNDRSF